MSSALIACPIYYRWDPTANPYWYEQAFVLFGLLIAVVAWWRTRPSPSRIVSGYLGTGALVTIAVTFEQSCDGVRRSEVPTMSLLILQASTALMVCMYVEIVRTLRERRAPALAIVRAVTSLRNRNVPHEGGALLRSRSRVTT